MIERLKGASADDLRTLVSVEDVPGVNDGRTDAIKTRLAELEKTRHELIDVEHLGLKHPQVQRVDLEIADNRKALQETYAANVTSVLTMLQNNRQSYAVDGCDALSMRLQVTAEPMTSAVSDPTETELWLVHRDSVGVETMQRQVVRSATGNGSFVFDDVVVKTDRGPVTVEVYGDVYVRSGPASPGGVPYLQLTVNRRYVAAAPSFGWKTKDGGTTFNQTIRPEEVVAFNLLPLKDDEGVLVGHRFSVRVRTKILK